MRLGEGQVAVVTGAASGIGLGLAHEFAARGLHVVLADVEGPALADAAEALRARGTTVLAVTTDVRSFAAVQAAAEATIERFGRIDIVCNNAGVNTAPGPVWELEENDWRWILDVNLWGVIHGLRAFVPLLLRQPAGHIVNTASMAALHPVAGLAPYAASKRAVVALSECLRADLDRAGANVGVTVLCPLWVWSRVREAERNRPAELGTARTRPARPPQSASEGEFQTPHEVARAVAAAIEADEPYLLTHTSGREEARAHQLRMLEVVDT
jgi:NAD(P)-dependent dehydrogenase (short-subunit alcohol dehydrogenase family)